MTSMNETWKATCDRLRKTLNADTYERWIAGIVPVSLTDRGCVLGVSNEMFSDWLNMNYRELIGAALGDVLGRQLSVSFESGHDTAVASGVDRIEAATTVTATDADGGDQAGTLGYNRRFTFDNFVVGENNKFAHAACYAVAKSPGKAYNPLFIHGATGLGKTHLLQAIAQELLAKRKRARVEFISSEEFANRYIDALRDRALPKFRAHYRNVHLLLIDDVHFFTGKEGFQEEFFHTFNALYNAHHQIVLTSDRPPHEIGGLEKRLVSRFEWGLTTDVSAPALETRIAILRRKQADHALKLSDEVLSFIATRIKSNIRRLEGALLRLVSYASVTGATVTPESAEQILGALLEEDTKSLITIEQIQRAVAEFYDIRLADMTSKRRPQNIAFPRQVAMYLSRKLTDYSSPTIGECFSRNHATILHAETMIAERVSTDQAFRRDVALLERKIRG